MNQSIVIIVNGHPETIRKDMTIADLIRYFQEYDTDLIVERNGRFVYPDQYDRLVLDPGDRVEFINPNFGG